jgi:hypothetical protein
MKKQCKFIMLILCISLLPFSTVHANINDLIYVLFVKAPNVVYVPTFEFEANNSLKVIGASWEYGELSGIWQESDLVAFSFFQAQVERSEPTTTTTTPEIPETTTRIQLSALQPAQSETTKFLIYLSGLVIPSLPFLPTISWMVGYGTYLGADVVFIGFTGISDAPAFGSIDPIFGLQEFTIPCTVTCLNTTFTDGNVEVQFTPDDGLDVQNISVQSDTEVQFNLVIDVDAPFGQKSVTVTYGSPQTSVTGNGVFTVVDPLNPPSL